MNYTDKIKSVLKKIYIVMGWGFFLWFVGLFIYNIANSAEIPTATFNAGSILWEAGEYQSAVDVWADLAENGNEDAAWTLFRIYRSDSNLGPMDMEKAMSWLVVLSNENVADARELMGDIYYYGAAVPQNYTLSAKWYEKYIQIERDPDILTRYATLLATGSGVRQDSMRAFKMLYEANAYKNYFPAFLLGKQVFSDMNTVDQFLARSYLYNQGRN